MFFKNDRFFRRLRVVLALDPRRIAIGEAVIDAIQEKFIPELREKIGVEADDRKRERLEDLLEEWERYGDRKTPEGFSWNEEGAKVIKSIANKFRISDSQAEELALEVTSRFYTRPKFRRFIVNYNYERGPDGLMKAFKKAIGQEAITQMRKRAQELKQRSLDEKTPYDDRSLGDQQGGIDIEFDRYLIRDTKKQMEKWVSKHLSSKDARLLFKMWLEAAERKGPDGIAKGDLYGRWSEETGKSDSRAGEHWKDIQKMIVRFLEEEEGVNVGRNVKKKLKISAEAVALRFVRKRLASWVLELYRGGVG